MTRRLLLLFVVLLSACRFDVDVAVVMEPDGTGVVTVVGTADAELVERAPDLFTDVALDDAIAAGWTVDGPSATDDGGSVITLTHSFESATELANLLNSIGPPLSATEVARTQEDERTTNAISAVLHLPDGFRSFADDDLIAAVGDLPFSADLAAAEATPEESMTFSISVDLPGQLVQAGTGTERGGVIEWDAPLDGSTTELYVSTVQQPAAEGSTWAGPVSKVLLIVLIGWVVLAAAFITFVAIARRRRRQRRERALRHLRERH